jgi:hypothetical protein
MMSILFQLEVFNSIPGIGAISGAVLNLEFMRRVDTTARRIFQERWLKDNGKVRLIAPAVAHSQNLEMGWTGVLRRAAYSGCYTVGFGVALPAYFLASLFERADDAVTQSIRDGANDARKRIEQSAMATERGAIALTRSARGRRLATFV